MGIVDRVKNILLTPKTEWEVIAAEPTQPKDLVTGYILPLAAVAAVAGLIGSAVIGTSILGTTYRMPIVWALVGAIIHLVMSVAFTFVVAFIVDALAPSFGAQKNFNQAFKVVAYSATAGWVGSVFGIIPWLGGLIALLFGLYCLYLLYLGLPRLMKGPADKAIGYTVVVVVSAIVVGAILAFALSLIMAPAMMAAGGFGSSAAPRITYDKDSKLGKLDEFARKMEEAGKKMEAAEKSGDPKKQMEAAMAVLGTAVSGGKGVEPVQIDQLKPFLPTTFAGMPQTSTQAERTGAAGFMTAKAEANYGDASGKNAELEVVDTGGAAGLMGLASWIGVQGEREDANRRERTRKEGNRMIHEEVDKRGGRNKYTVVVAERFVVSAEANGVDINALKSAVNALDLAKLEATK
jgi:Yip1-like protein